MAFFGVAFSELSAQEVQGRFMLNLTTLFLKVLKVLEISMFFFVVILKLSVRES